MRTFFLSSMRSRSGSDFTSWSSTVTSISRWVTLKKQKTSFSINTCIYRQAHKNNEKMSWRCSPWSDQTKHGQRYVAMLRSLRLYAAYPETMQQSPMFLLAGNRKQNPRSRLIMLLNSRIPRRTRFKWMLAIYASGTMIYLYKYSAKSLASCRSLMLIMWGYSIKF